MRWVVAIIAFIFIVKLFITKILPIFTDAMVRALTQ